MRTIIIIWLLNKTLWIFLLLKTLQVFMRKHIIMCIMENKHKYIIEFVCPHIRLSPYPFVYLYEILPSCPFLCLSVILKSYPLIHISATVLFLTVCPNAICLSLCRFLCPFFAFVYYFSFVHFSVVLSFKLFV